MRKLYALLTWLCISLVSIPTIAQTPTADKADFTFTIDAANNNVVFSNTSVIGNLAGNRHAIWSFGDGSAQWTGLHDGTQHHYLSAGSFTVCLRIYRFIDNTNDSVLSAEECKTVVIEPVCRANFEYRDSIAHIDPLKHLVHFWAIPFNNGNKPVSQICWNFGDGSDTCINFSPNYPPTTSLAINHSYDQQGPYNVCVRIKYLDGCVSEKCKEVVLQNIPPDSCAADFERIQSTSNTTLAAYFRALPKHNNNKNPETICWKFGDGKDTCIKYEPGFTGQYVIPHYYQQAGSYEVCVDITYAGGCEARLCKVIKIGEPDSCRADFETISVAANPLRKYFTASPWHNHNKKPVYICWNFGDNKDTCIQYSVTQTAPYAVGHNYEHTGQFEVCVRIVYDGGCESKNCKTITIERPDTCAVDFEKIPTLSTINRLRTYFRALPKHNNNNKPETICWKFGDGKDTCIKYEAGFTGQYVVAHNYLQAGSYEVCVDITYAGGCEAKQCKTIRIGEADSCRAGFETISVAANPLRKYFTATPWHNHNKKPVYICWNFGDNKDTCIQYSTTQTTPYVVGHTYEHTGKFEVCVRIVYDGGCESKNCKTITIERPDTCGADFERIPTITSINQLR
ncbi:MAG: PKD domain-containing protein, partial [Bacteroidia bacterium]|nr:PKD domain-containing protein [Bacteroidia bacterium]